MLNNGQKEHELQYEQTWNHEKICLVFQAILGSLIKKKISETKRGCH